MFRAALVSMVLSLALAGLVSAEGGFTTDTIVTREGDLAVTFIGHGSLIFKYAGKVIHVDPFGKLADYSKLPDADIILVTHDHRDHLDPLAIQEIRKSDTVILSNASSAPRIQDAVVLKNGDSRTVGGVFISAVPAYNLVHERSPGVPYHPKGIGNGYVLTFADKKVYVAGDTENIPEMAALKGIHAAFIPMNLPYTMTPEMAAEAARSFKPDILYPYHFGETEPLLLKKLLSGESIEVRIRNMQ